MNVADTVRMSLEKDPKDRTVDDIETILGAVQHLQVWQHLPVCWLCLLLQAASVAL